MNISILNLDTEIMVTAPFNIHFADAAKNLGAKYREPHWVFDNLDEYVVRKTLIGIYGTDGSSGLDAEVVTLRVTAYDGISSLRGPVVIADKMVAQASGLDSDVKLGEGVVFLSGGTTIVGTVKDWRTYIKKGSVFEISGVPRAEAVKTIENNSENFLVDISNIYEEDLQYLFLQKTFFEGKLAGINSEIDSIKREHKSLADEIHELARIADIEVSITDGVIMVDGQNTPSEASAVNLLVDIIQEQKVGRDRGHNFDLHDIEIGD